VKSGVSILDFEVEAAFEGAALAGRELLVVPELAVFAVDVFVAGKNRLQPNTAAMRITEANSAAKEFVCFI
jgi:hypothetical protein